VATPRESALKAVVLCAGMGTRLGALTAHLPKPMLRIGGEPLLAHTLRYLARHEIDWVAVNLHFMPDVIPAYFGDGARFGVHIHYAREERLLGTAGTVRALAGVLVDANEVLVLYGDLLIDQNLYELARVHRDTHADATLLVHRNPGSNSLVRMEEGGRITAFVERPDEEERRKNPHSWVNSGVALLGPGAREAIPEKVPADLPRDVYVPSLSRLRLFGAPLTGFRCAIDSPERLARAEEALEKGFYDPAKRVVTPKESTR
jgi:NDP-sugar pyrophosphorylase family protein